MFLSCVARGFSDGFRQSLTTADRRIRVCGAPANRDSVAANLTVVAARRRRFPQNLPPGALAHTRHPDSKRIAGYSVLVCKTAGISGRTIQRFESNAA